MINITPIRNNWSTERCKPYVIPFAGIINAIAIEYNMAYVAIECNSFGLVTSLRLKNDLSLGVIYAASSCHVPSAVGGACVHICPRGEAPS